MAIPELRKDLSGHPYIMIEPSLYSDYHMPDEGRVAQSQLMFFYLNGAVDYSTHLLLKDILDHLQNAIIKSLSYD